MAWVKGALAVLVTVGAIVGGLLATGAVRVRHESAAAEGAARESGEDPGLEGLGYLAVEARPEDEGKQGVTRPPTEKAAEGLVLYNYCGWGPGLQKASLDEPWGETYLMDLEGKVVHRWDSDAFGPQRHGRSISRLLPDGSLVINIADTGIARLAWDGDVMWKRRGVYHHDHTADADGNVYALVEREHGVAVDDETHVILDHGIQHISPDGEAVKTWWLSDSLAEDESFLRRAARARRKNRWDVIHANSIELLQEHPDGLWDDGDFLTSARNLDMVLVVSRETGEVLWKWGPGELEQQHSPTQSADGRILIFDNGSRRKWSRIVEVDPSTQKITWEYEGTDDHPFYSRTRGIVQRLTNGNLFVVSSNAGRIFELTPDKEIVWEFYSSESHGKKRVPIRGVRVDGALLEHIQALLT